MVFPKTLYARFDEPEDADPIVWVELADAVEDNGPTDLGVYELVRMVTASKKVTVEKKGVRK